MRFSMTTVDKRFYRNVMRLVMPMALQNLINMGVTSTDVIMLGEWERQRFPCSWTWESCGCAPFSLITR